MKLSKNDITSVAALARLGLTTEEQAKYQKEVSAILDYVEQLNAVDTTGVQPITNITGLSHRVRADESVAFADRKKLLDAAPATQGGQLKVKGIFSE